MERLPPEVAEVAGRYLAQVDQRLPGAVDGLYLLGSLALDDYRPGQSDVDFVAVSEDPLDDAALDELEVIHADLLAPFHFDGIYVTYRELATDPAGARTPSAHEGRLARSGAFEVNPVVWHMMARKAIPVRGPAPDRLAVRWAPEAMRSWSLDNLNGYWAGLVARWRDTTPSRELVVHHYGLPWPVLGVSRLHHTVATAEVTSKAGGGRWALDTFGPRWHPVVSTCLALRDGTRVELYGEPAAMWGDGLDFAEMVIADARRLPGVTAS